MAALFATLPLISAPATTHAAPFDLVVSVGLAQGTANLPAGFELNTLGGSRLWGVAGLAFGLDWQSYATNHFVLPAHERNEGAAPRSYELRNATVDRFPLYGHAYVRWGEERLSAMMGLGGGYQMVFVEADDFTTQILGGMGGVIWSGVHRELFHSRDGVIGYAGVEGDWHFGRVTRDTFDRGLAVPVRQELDTSGWSIRLALGLGQMSRAADRAGRSDFR